MLSRTQASLRRAFASARPLVLRQLHQRARTPAAAAAATGAEGAQAAGAALGADSYGQASSASSQAPNQKRRPRERAGWGSGSSLKEELKHSERTEQYFDAFRSHQDVAGPSDLVCLLEGLWPVALSEHGSSGHVGQVRKKLFNATGFMQIMKDVVWKLDRFGPKELPRLLAALHTMTWSDPHLFKLAEAQVVRHMPGIQLEELPRLVTSYVEVRCGSRMLFEEFVRRCSQAAGRFDQGALADLVTAFSRGPHKPKAFLLEVGPFVVESLPVLSSAQLASIAEAYARWPRDVPEELAEGLATRLCEEEGKLVKEMSPGQVVAVLRALVLWKKRRRGEQGTIDLSIADRVFQLAAEPLLQGREELTPDQAATAFWSFTKMTAVPKTLFKGLYQDLVRGAGQLPEPALAACLLVSARGAAGQIQTSVEATEDEADEHGDEEEDGGSSPSASSAEALCDLQLLDASEERVRGVVTGFDTRDLTSVVLAYSMSHAGSPELFAVLHKACLDRCRMLAMEQVATLGWSFATIRLGSSFFREAQFDVLEKINQLTIPGICDVLWAYCATRHRDAHFFKALLSVLVPSRIAGDPRCALLYPALLDIRAHLPEMDPEGLERYMGYARDDFHRSQLAALPPAAALQSLASALTELDVSFKVAEDVDGYAVDVLVAGSEADGQRPVAVLYHSAPRTLHLRTNEPLGQTLMRQRHLRFRGYGVVNLWDRMWEGLDLRARADFLRPRLAEAARPSPPREEEASGPGGE